MLKKAILTISIISIFTVYSIYQSHSSVVPGLLPINSAQTIPNPAITGESTADNSANGSYNDQPSVPKPTPKPTPRPISVALGAYRDGTYTGNSADAYYGLVQVQAVISGGRLTNINFLNYPRDNGNSLSRSNYALPILRSEAIAAQKTPVDIVSQATDTSEAFNQSLAYALNQAKN